METFKFCIRPKFTIENEPKRNIVQFGDGYAQRSRKTINALLRSYPVVVKVRNNVRLEVDNFLARHGGVEPFYFNDPYTGTKKKVVCGKWSAAMGQVYTEFSCEFEEVP
ncbi:phage tail protein [Testudinibacter sp. TR-2022]|uniref:phage tail protein n=1 Tax=Testudinibacter sp. TR-2022 TaxID=2585029 RepID=UPI001119984C|nr:phage tail protein [Testudinibacter sp. TR-2022]TNH06621.1 phage tail protein [Pasteurellaceae bacterium Phil11]TNH25540.1 phage tail protein [Testudinibacter sp. TR-2022]TNH25680.1 phage tail protein [Testudinibacter sp. TR-2022]